MPVEKVCDSCCVSSKEVRFRLNFDKNGVFKGFSRLCSSVSGFVVVLVVIVVVVAFVVDVVPLEVFRRFGLYFGRFVEVFFLNL